MAAQKSWLSDPSPIQQWKRWIKVKEQEEEGEEEEESEEVEEEEDEEEEKEEEREKRRGERRFIQRNYVGKKSK